MIVDRLDPALPGRNGKEKDSRQTDRYMRNARSKPRTTLADRLGEHTTTHRRTPPSLVPKPPQTYALSPPPECNRPPPPFLPYPTPLSYLSQIREDKIVLSNLSQPPPRRRSKKPSLPQTRVINHGGELLGRRCARPNRGVQGALHRALRRAVLTRRLGAGSRQPHRGAHRCWDARPPALRPKLTPAPCRAPDAQTTTRAS